jgi:hypothetical protein
MRVHCLPAAIFLLFCIQAFAQTSDPKAAALAAKSIAAMAGGNAVSDVTLSGSVTSSDGSDEQSGTATFLAKGIGESRVDLNLSNGTRTDIQAVPNGLPMGAWSRDGRAWSHYSQHNSWTGANWFFPALTSLGSSNRSTVLLYVGQEQREGISVEHLRSCRASVPRFAQQLSQMDFYLNSASLLPIAVAFSVHPDNNVSINIPVEVNYSDYRPSNGILVPMHIQRYMQGSLVLDVVVTAVSINSGLPDSDFAIQ